MRLKRRTTQSLPYLQEALIQVGAEVIGVAATVEEALVAVAAPSLTAAIVDLRLNGRSVRCAVQTLTDRDLPFIVYFGLEATYSWVAAKKVPLLLKPLSQRKWLIHWRGLHLRICRVGILELGNRTSLKGVTVKVVFANELQNQLRELFTLPYVKAAQAKAELLTGAFKRSAYHPLLLLRLANLVGVHRTAMN